MDTFPVYKPAALLGNYVDRRPLPSFWRTLCFPAARTFLSDDRSIRFSKVSSQRHIAPFVSPKSTGTPTYNAREAVAEVSTAYIKLQDAVLPDDFSGLRAVGVGDLTAATPMTPIEKYDARVRELALRQAQEIDNRLEFMAFEAVANGIITVKDDETNIINLVNFRRSTSHTITLGAGTRWNEVAADPLEDLSNWKELAERPKSANPEDHFGSAPTYWIMGPLALKAFRQNPKVRAELDLNYARNGQTLINTGVLNGQGVQFIGQLSNGDQVWRYSQFYNDKTTGAVVEIMNPRDVIGVDPAALEGVTAYGTIQNLNAGLVSAERFPSMWMKPDGSAAFMQTESAPMLIPVNPNATLRARVVA